MAEKGKYYRCRIRGQEVLVTKPGPGTLVCCDEPMSVTVPASEKEVVMAEKGKYYRCIICAQEVLVTKPGPGTLFCCNEPMSVTVPTSEW